MFEGWQKKKGGGAAAAVYHEVAGSGEPVILVHGLSGSTRWWARNVGPLSRRFRVYVVDLDGFGASRARRPFVLGEAAGRLARWMDEQGIERASVVGHSMGGFIAADLASKAPERVARLVLVCAAIFPAGHGLRRPTVGTVRALQHLPLSFLPLLVTDAYRAGPRIIFQAARGLLTAGPRPELARVRAPALLVWGEHDTLVPLEVGRGLERGLRDARLVVIGGAGHNPMWETPEKFNRLVADFLTQGGRPGIGPGAGRPGGEAG